MAAWWYSDSNNKIGPVEEDELSRLLQTGKVGYQTLLWKEGLDTWQPFQDISELEHLKNKIPPPIPSKPITPTWAYPMAGRWQRFVARVFDLWLEVLIVSFLSGIILGRYSSTFVEMINSANSQFIGILYFPFALLLDGAIYRFFGNTPGKAIIGLKVGNLDASPLTFKEYLRRNFSLWVSGLAFGLPFFNLIAMFSQFSRLKKGEQTSYDTPYGYKVRAKPVAWWNAILFVTLFIALLAVVITLNIQERESQDKAIKSVVSKNYQWINPITNEMAMVNSDWENQTKENTDGQVVYMFSERTNHAAVILGMEPTQNISLDRYVELFRENTANSMHFSDGGTYDQYAGYSRWQGYGSMLEDENSVLKVELVKVGDNVWRIVSVQALPYEYSTVMVKNLKSSLWKTVFNKS